jgi:hypothetical protein
MKFDKMNASFFLVFLTLTGNALKYLKEVWVGSNVQYLLGKRLREFCEKIREIFL